MPNLETPTNGELFNAVPTCASECEDGVIIFLEKNDAT
jgi:hypothetical protein